MNALKEISNETGDLIVNKNTDSILGRKKFHSLYYIEGKGLRVVLNTNFTSLQVRFIRKEQEGTRVEKCHVIFFLVLKESEVPDGGFVACCISQEWNPDADTQLVCRFEVKPVYFLGDPPTTVAVCTFPVPNPIRVWDLVTTLYGSNQRCVESNRSDLTTFKYTWGPRSYYKARETGEHIDGDTLKGCRDFM